MKRRGYFLRGSCVFIAIVFCLLAPQFQEKRKFPFVGKWLGSVKLPSGTINTLTLEFTQDGKCFFGIGYHNGLKERIRCSCYMEGDRAFLHYTKHYSVFVDRITPSKEGDVVNLVAIKATYMNSETNEVEKVVNFKEPEVKLRRIK